MSGFTATMIMLGTILVLMLVIIGLLRGLLNRIPVVETAVGLPADPAFQAGGGAVAAPRAMSQDGSFADAELVAVIAAAINAFEEGRAGAGSLVIRKIDRVSGRTTPWLGAGRADCIESRKL